MSTAKRWLKTEDVMRLLELSASTVQTLRRNGTLPFSRVGAVIFYDAKDVDRMLEERKQRKSDLIQNRKSSPRYNLQRESV
jgi:predicted DNA-binding transcriptional regulator AlpA